MGSSGGMDRCGKSRPHWDSIHGPSSPYRIDIPTELTRPTYNVLSRATRLRAEGTGVGIPVEVRDVSLFSNSEATYRRHPVSQSVCRSSFPIGNCRYVKFATEHHLLPKTKMCGTINIRPLYVFVWAG